MVGSENKLVTVFSWADEVEKEEEEEAAARTHVHEKKKPNPFGSARPREIVLQEKGIDWRKLDQDLQQLPRTRSEPRREKAHKENIPAPAAAKKGLEHKLENTKMGSNRREVPHPQTLSTHQNHITEVFVPPLRYPPKNVASLLKETRNSYNSYMSASGQSDFHYKNPSEGHWNDIHQYNNLLDQHKFSIEWESQHAVFDSMEVLQNGRKLGKSVSGEEGRIADSNCKRTKFFEHNFVGSSSMIERKGAILVHHDIRWPLADGRDCKNIHSDYAGRDGRRRWYHGNSGKEKTGYRGNFNGEMPRCVTEEINWEKMEYDEEQQNFDRKFAVSASDGGKAKGSHNVKMREKC